MARLGRPTPLTSFVCWLLALLLAGPLARAQTITGFTPASGPVGTSVTVTGTGLSGATAAFVNGTAGTITGTPTAGSLTFTVGAGSTSGPVSVNTPGGTATSGSSFTVVPPPFISSFSPTSGPVGTRVTVTGTDLNGATAVRVNGTAGTLVGTPSATSLTFRVNAGSTSGPISVTTAGGSGTSSASFTVVPLLAVTALSPTRNRRNASAATDVAVTFSLPLQNTAATLGAVQVFSQQRGGRMIHGARGTATVRARR